MAIAQTGRFFRGPLPFHGFQGGKVVKGMAARRHFIDRAAGGIDIVRRGRRASLQTLRAGVHQAVGGQAQAFAQTLGHRRTGGAGPCRHFRDIEIQKHQPSLRSQEDVTRFNIAVGNALVMQKSQGAEQFRCPGDCLLAHAVRVLAEFCTSRCPFQEFHAEADTKRLAVQIKDTDNAGMRQMAQDAELLRQSEPCLGMRTQLRQEPLQRDLRAGVAAFHPPEIERRIHLAHPAGTQQFLQVESRIAVSAVPATVCGESGAPWFAGLLQSRLAFVSS